MAVDIKVSLDNLWPDDYNTISDIIRDEINQEVRRIIKREVKAKTSKLNKAIVAYADKQADEINKRIKAFDAAPK